MSHNVSMSGIPWKDMTILGRALEEINKEYGTKFELKVGAVPSRNYGVLRNKVLPNTVAVISDPSMSYDITVKRNPKTGENEVEAEALLISPLIAAFKLPTKVQDIANNQMVDIGNVGYRMNETLGMKAALGPITQRYALLVAEQQAAMQGHSCRRQLDKKTGVITLVASVM